MSAQLAVRAATPADAPHIAAIYNEGIGERSATFETRERTTEDVLRWLEGSGYPVLVAERTGEVVGWVAASSYRPRQCYAGVAEFSVYVAAYARRQGIADALMREFLAALEATGFWKVVARIFPENTASRALCARHGFREVGIYRRHAQLDGVWRDVVIVEKLLGNTVG